MVIKNNLTKSEIKMSEEMKMSDVFGLPLVVCRANPSMITAKPTYKGKVDYHQATLRSNHEVHVIYGAHAINVHDANQETITKLTTERDKTISLMSQSWQHEPQGEELIYNHTKTLLEVIERGKERIKELESALREAGRWLTDDAFFNGGELDCKISSLLQKDGE